MKFLELNEYISENRNRYENYPVPGFFVSDGVTGEADIRKIEDALGCRLGVEIRKILSKINFGNLRIGWLSFGFGQENVGYIVKTNEAKENWWWRSNPDILRIAETDGWTVFVDSGCGMVYCAETDLQELQPLSNSFIDFIRVVGTLSLAREVRLDEDLVEQIERICGFRSRFWLG